MSQREIQRASALAALCLAAIASPQEDVRALNLAREFLSALGRDASHARIYKRDVVDPDFYIFVVHADECEVRVSPEPLNVWQFNDFRLSQRGASVPDLDAAAQIAREFCAQVGWPVYELDVALSRRRDAGEDRETFFVYLAKAPPGPYPGARNTISFDVDAASGQVRYATARLGTTYAEAEVRLSADEAASRALPRIRAVYGLEGAADRVEGPLWTSDPPPGDTRGDLADDYGPSRGGARHCRLAYIVHASAQDRYRLQHFELTVDAKDGTVMAGFMTKSTAAKQAGAATGRAKEEQEPAGRPGPSPGWQLALAGGAFALAAAGWWLVRTRRE